MVRGNRDPASPAVRVEPVGAHVDEWMRARARGVVAVHARGAEDLRLFLDALGIDERSAGLREARGHRGTWQGQAVPLWPPPSSSCPSRQSSWSSS